METSLQIVWWIGLVGALILTLAILKQVSLVLRTLRDLHRLAEDTRHAAHGLAESTLEAPRLAGLRAFDQVREAMEATAAAAAAIDRRLAAHTETPNDHTRG